MNEIVPMYQFDMIQVRFQQGSEGVQPYQNSLHFKFSPISVESGSSNISFFQNSKQFKLSQGGGIIDMHFCMYFFQYFVQVLSLVKLLVSGSGSYSGHCRQKCKRLLSNATLRFLNFAELCPTQIFASGSAYDSPLIKL